MTFAPGITAPVASLTVPEIVPRSDCPNKTALVKDIHSNSGVAEKIRLVTIVVPTP
jgi:hypothetical protein